MLPMKLKRLKENLLLYWGKFVGIVALNLFLHQIIVTQLLTSVFGNNAPRIFRFIFYNIMS